LLFSKTNFANAEWLILPGGMPGATNLSEFAPLNSLLISHAQRGKIAAICAAPAVVLAPLGLLDDKEATCYPGFEKLMPKAIRRDSPVIALNNIITANGPSSALRFALAIVANSMGDEVAQEVGSGMLFYPKSMNFYF
jgi:4-methyl-5(b-hydroxyethyl)-thiazole monophosphate biosynthesis